jgi:hypothetical protein
MSWHTPGTLIKLFKKLEALSLEGMVMKRKDSVYSAVQSRNWLKVSTVAAAVNARKKQGWNMAILKVGQQDRPQLLSERTLLR